MSTAVPLNMQNSVPQNSPHIMIGTPAYGGMVHVDYVSSLLLFAGSGIPFTLVTIGNESLITRARNTIFAAFHARPQFSHLLFLDGDVRMAAASLARLVNANVDVIGAPVALKGRNPDGTRMWNVGQCVGEAGELTVCDRIGTAVFMLSRKAVAALADDAMRRGAVYGRSPRTQRGDFDADIHYDVFSVGVVEGEYLSEDFWACHRLRQLGFKIHVDPTVVTQHHGTVAF